MKFFASFFLSLFFSFAVFAQTNGEILATANGQNFVAADLPAKPYPADYFETVEQARQERDSGFEPALKARIPGIAAYQTIFLCFPVWGETAPPVIRSFLTAHDLSAKTLVPVITHGGYGLGSSLSVLRSHAPKARLLDGFTMQGPRERETTTRVTEWLNTEHKAN